MKTSFPITSACIVVLLFVSAINRDVAADNVQKPNVLFISVDDLRPELGCYGNREIRTSTSLQKVPRYSRGLIAKPRFVRLRGPA